MINIDKIIDVNKEKKRIRTNTFKQILQMFYNKIELVSQTGITECWFEVPKFLLGHPSYDVSECCIYLEKKLKKKNFTETKYFKPNILYVNWTTTYSSSSDEKK